MTATNLSPARSWLKPPSPPPPAASQPAPKEQSCFPAHPEPPVYKWHMPGSCPVKQLQPDPTREKRCERKKKSQLLGENKLPPSGRINQDSVTPTRVKASNGKHTMEHIQETFVQIQVAVNKPFSPQTTGIGAIVPSCFFLFNLLVIPKS